MENQYLTGRLTVCYATDTVELAHKVNGRFSFVDLAEGDFIEVNVDGKYETVSVQNVLERNNGQSFYEGSRAKVKLSLQGNQLIKSRGKKNLIESLFLSAEQGYIPLSEVKEALIKWETYYEDKD